MTFRHSGVRPFSRQVSSKDAFRQNPAHVFQPQPSAKQTLAPFCPVLPVMLPSNTGNQMGKRSAPVVAHKPSGLGHRRPCYLKIRKHMNVVLNKSSQEPPFRNSFANLSPAFAVPKGLHFPKSRIRIRNQIYGIKQIRLQTLQ